MALAGAIVPGGVVRFIVMLSAHAEVFGVGITAIAVGSMLVSARSGVSGGIAPGGGFAGMSGVESGNAAPLVGGPPGVELHTMFEDTPSGAVGDTVPVVLATIGVGMVPNAVGVVAVDGIVIIAVVPPAMDGRTAPGVVAVNGAIVLLVVDAEDVAGGVSNGAATANVGGTGTVEPGIVDRKDVPG